MIAVVFALTATIMLPFAASASVVIDNRDTFVESAEQLWGGTNPEAVTSNDAQEGTGYVKAGVSNGMAILGKE